ncbi:MAG: thioredoxin [Chromatiales bacterium]|nr:thioredoxin [Chromatiales bacterium]
MAVVELTKDNFEETVTKNGFVVVDFWAPWCAPCRNFAPIYEQVSELREGIVFGKVNTEEEQELAMHFRIRSIPTLMILRDQIIIHSEAGMMPQPAFEELLDRAAGVDMDQVRAKIAEQQSSGQA